MANFHFNSWLFRLPYLNQFEAITLPWGVYFACDESEVSQDDIDHEMVHFRQREKIGAARFYIDYVCQFMRNLTNGLDIDTAYRSISYEVEAYEHDAAHALGASQGQGLRQEELDGSPAADRSAAGDERRSG